MPFTTTGVAGGATVQMLVERRRHSAHPRCRRCRAVGRPGESRGRAARGFSRASSGDEHAWRRRRVYDGWRQSLARVLHQCADRSGSVGKPLRRQRAAPAHDDDQRCLRAVGRTRRGGQHAPSRSTARRQAATTSSPWSAAIPGGRCHDAPRRTRSVAGRGGDRPVGRGDARGHHRAGRWVRTWTPRAWPARARTRK